MANKKKNIKTKNKANTALNILIIAITVLVVAIIILITISNSNKDNTKSILNEDNTKTENIISNNEVPIKEADKFAMSKIIADMNISENPVATLEMENGGIVKIELYPNVAPNTVCNFIELSNNGFYDGLIFHRCIQGFMIQGGDPEGTGMGGPDYDIAGEFTINGFENNLSHDEGVISMARQSYPLDSAGSQFFITVSGNYKNSLDGNYASFGKVISGMDVVHDIVAIETNANDKPVVDQVIKSIRVDTKGITYPESIKIKGE